MRDLPYDQSYFIENIIDPAHVPISHDGVMGNRNDAQPLEMEVIESSIAGIRGRYRKLRSPNQSWIYLDFIAPNLMTYKVKFEQRGWLGGVYRIPTESYKNKPDLKILSVLYHFHMKMHRKNPTAYGTSPYQGEVGRGHIFSQKLSKAQKPFV